MADVQLQHGYIRIANALDEAIICAAFTATQMKIVRCILRLTYGWQRKTVRVSHAQLSERCDVPMTGSFRRQLDELIAEGVIIEVERAIGRTPATYAIRKNFEQWGRLSVPAAKLQRLFGERLPTADRLPPEGHTIEEGASEQTAPRGADKSPETAPTGAELNGRFMPPQDESYAPVGRELCPPEGIVAGSNSANGADLEAPKDIERHERQLLLHRAEKFAERLAGAANNANAERYGEWTRIRPYLWSTATQLCFELLKIGVSEDMACEVVADSIRRQKKTEPVNGIGYYANVITDAHKAAEQRTLDAQNPAPKPRGGAPSRVAVATGPRKVFTASTADREREQLAAYAVAKTEAGMTWGKDPSNADRYAAIVREASEPFAGFLEQGWAQRQRDEQIVLKCAEAAGFPPFEQWSADDVLRGATKG